MCHVVSIGRGLSIASMASVCRCRRLLFLRADYAEALHCTPQDRKRGDKDKRSDKKDAKRLKRDEKEESVDADEEYRQDEDDKDRRKKSKYVAVERR